MDKFEIASTLVAYHSMLVSIEAQIEFEENVSWRNMGDKLAFPDAVMFDIPSRATSTAATLLQQQGYALSPF